MISGVRRAKGLQEQLQYLKEILREQRKDTTGGVGRVPQEGGGTGAAQSGVKNSEGS